MTTHYRALFFKFSKIYPGRMRIIITAKSQEEEDDLQNTQGAGCQSLNPQQNNE
jgi:hypothetical protein